MLILIALPIAAQNLISFAIQMADTVMLGALGQTQLTAASLANPALFRVYRADLRAGQRGQRSERPVLGQGAGGAHPAGDGAGHQGGLCLFGGADGADPAVSGAGHADLHAGGGGDPGGGQVPGGSLCTPT